MLTAVQYKFDDPAFDLSLWLKKNYTVNCLILENCQR